MGSVPPLARYVLFQLPGWGIVGLLLVWLWPRTGLDDWLGAAVLTAWVAKDLALYPLLRRAYEPTVETGGALLIGLEGVSRTRLDPAGYIAVRGELWRARISAGTPPIDEGTPVVVAGAAGLELSVAPVAPHRR
jgi:membrane-bound ClpP family serine protease